MLQSSLLALSKRNIGYLKSGVDASPVSVTSQYQPYAKSNDDFYGDLFSNKDVSEYCSDVGISQFNKKPFDEEIKRTEFVKGTSNHTNCFFLVYI